MPDYDKYATVLAKQEGRLLTVAFNRPERMNAVGGGLNEDFTAILETARDDKSVGAILLRGEGRAFCVGGDVKDFAERSTATEGPSPAETVRNTLHGTAILDTILSVPQPIVAAVHGYAMGLGATIALFCDVVIATEDATFADSHVAVALVAGDGGAVMWPLIMPFGAAKWYLMTGDRISGTEAARLGMVLKAVPADQLIDEATAAARRLADGAPLAVQGTKATINRILRSRMDLVLDYGLLIEGATFVSEDHREASVAFVEKRAPVFRGR
jgi:enoyl-CoA hydratase